MKKYIANTLFLFVFFVLPISTHASGLTSTQIQAILSLLSSFGADSATIANVQTSLSGGTPSATAHPFCHTFYNNITVGSTNKGSSDVSALNQALAASGIDTTNNSSVFNENNAEKVVSFQAKYGIRQTGFVGPITRAKLNALYGCRRNQQSVQPTQSTQPTNPTGSSISQSTPTRGLQSAFFHNDTNAQNILSGSPAPLNEYGSATSNSFAWKFLNGLRQIGYTGNSSLLPSLGRTLLDQVHKFQRLNNFAERNEIEAPELMKLDSLIFAKETSDARLAANLPLTDTVVGGSSSEPAAAHVKALFLLALQSLPTSIVKWNAENMSNYIHVQGSGGDGFGFQYRPQGICFMDYFPSLDSECNPTSTTNTDPGLLKDDTSLVYNILHEYAHYIDGYVYGASQSSVTSEGIINTNGFRAISYDTSSNCQPSSSFGFFKLKNPGNERNEFLTNYAALSIRKNGDEGCRSSSEDFAESFSMYVMQGNTFRKLAETKPIIAQKYAWLKNNVFNGKEYFTGNPQNIPLLNQALTAPYSQMLPSFIDYFTINPDFVWDYSL